jgi:hypothetical protein
MKHFAVHVEEWRVRIDYGDSGTPPRSYREPSGVSCRCKSCHSPCRVSTLLGRKLVMNCYRCITQEVISYDDLWQTDHGKGGRR